MRKIIVIAAATLLLASCSNERVEQKVRNGYVWTFVWKERNIIQSWNDDINTCTIALKEKRKADGEYLLKHGVLPQDTTKVTCTGPLPSGYEFRYNSVTKQYVIYHITYNEYYVDGGTATQRMCSKESAFADWIGKYTDTCAAKTRFFSYYYSQPDNFKPLVK